MDDVKELCAKGSQSLDHLRGEGSICTLHVKYQWLNPLSYHTFNTLHLGAQWSSG